MSNKETIARLRAEADALEQADKAFEELPEEHRLAINLHQLLCHHNHIDGCGWEYEGLPNKGGADWNGHAHSHYLQKALVLKGACRELKIPIDKAIDLFKIMKGL